MSESDQREADQPSEVLLVGNNEESGPGGDNSPEKGVQIDFVPLVRTQSRTFSQHEKNILVGLHVTPIAEENRKGWRKYIGIILALLSTLMFSFTQVGMKMVLGKNTKRGQTHYNPFNMGVWTFPIQIIFTVPFLIYYILFQKKSPWESIRPLKSHRKTIILIFVRSFSESGAFLLFYFSLTILDVGDAIVILSCAPVFVFILCKIFLKEPVGYIIIGTALLAIGGVVVIARPPGLTGQEFDKGKLMGIVFALTATIGLSVSMVAVRFMKQMYHGVLNTLSHIAGVILSIVIGGSMKVLSFPKSLYEGGLLVSCAAMTVSAQTLLIMALQREQAGPVALMRTFGVVLAFFWQWAFFQQNPDEYSLIGGVMIVVGVVVTILRKWISALPEDNPTRRRFRFLLF